MLTAYNIVPGSQTSGYPAFIFLNKGAEQDRMTGFPADTTGWTDDDWLAELALCKQQVQQKLDALVKLAG